ncbi:uncharacterized protein LOC120177198 [Hibiscus syriacus]|uniref:uncharacterized protein LOC120177198 n=1 Tax=Hibiscus syriacus TaxID=106335 RepID=UPI00192164D1|nr:uncharacterized protein LOC120177198 [Hibiscus syriacus]
MLLDTMDKNDLALKGKFEGVELLIFPSNQLHEHCQRWNNLLFLWGVFKERKANCSNFSKSVCNPDASMVPLERQISTDIPQPVDNESATCDSSFNVVPVTTGVEKTYISTDSVVNIKVSSLEQTYGGTKAKLEEQYSKVDPKLLSRISTSSRDVHSKMKCTSTREESIIPDCRSDPELNDCLQATETRTGSLKVEEEMHIEEDYTSLKDSPTGKQEAVVEEKVDRDSVKIRDSKDDARADGKTSSNRDLDCWQYYPSLKDSLTRKQEAIVEDKVDGDSVKIRDSKDDGCADGKASSNREADCWQLNHLKRPYIDLTEPVCEISTVTSQQIPWSGVTRVSVDTGNGNKKLKTGFSGTYLYSSARDQVPFSYSLASNRYNQGSGSSVEEKRCDITCEEKFIPEDLSSSKRFFFSMDSHCAGELQLGNSKPWQEPSVKDGYRLLF